MFQKRKMVFIRPKNDWDLKIKLASSIFRECIKTIVNKNKRIRHSFSEYVLLAGRLSIKYLAMQKESRMEIKSQKDLLRKIWKNESLKNNCLNKVYKIEKGAEWDFKNEIFDGENKVKFFWSQIKTISPMYHFLSND